MHASANATGGATRSADFALFSTVFDPIATGPEKIPRTGNGHQIGGKTNADGESWFTVHGYLIWEKTTADGERITTVHGCQIGKNESLVTVHGSTDTI